jgi:hypothetical protein
MLSVYFFKTFRIDALVALISIQFRAAKRCLNVLKKHARDFTISKISGIREICGVLLFYFFRTFQINALAPRTAALMSVN